MAENQFVCIDLKSHYNLDGTATSEDIGKGRLDGQFALAAEALPEEGRFIAFEIPFQFPATRTKGNNCLVPEGQAVKVDAGPYRALFLLGTSVMGSSTAEVELAFKDNEKVEETVSFTDWCHLPQFNELEAIQNKYRLCASGWAAPANSIWMQVILLPPDKTLEAITFKSCPNMRIFALTLSKGTYEPPPPTLLYYLLKRLSAKNRAAGEFNKIFYSLMDIHHLMEDDAILKELEGIRAALLEEVTVEDLFRYEEKKVSQSMKQLLPRLKKVWKEAKKTAAARSGEPALDITLIGHSHLDAVWLWPWNETVEKAYRTFSRNLERFKTFPDVTFNQSCPLFYRWMEKHFPHIFEGIRQQVEAGRWEIVGGMWVEPDGNMPSGESLVRQRLFGQRYFLKKFGKLSEVAWIPDTFGMHANHPQIIRKTGGRYFFTTKISWNYENVFPYHHFIWESPDGSQVLALQSAVGCGESPGPHKDLIKTVKERNRLLKKGKTAVTDCSSPHVPEEKLTSKFIPEVLVIYGEGDGGEGPSDKMLQRAQTLGALKGYRNGTIHDHFRKVEKKYMNRLPVWRDELYLENHRGTSTSQGRIKELCRKAEAALLAAEKWSTLSTALGGYKPAQGEMEQAWKKLLFNQFHDILPGTSIPQAYVDAELDFDLLLRTCSRVQEEALRSLASRINTRPTWGEKKTFGKGRVLLLFNPLSWERKETVVIPWGFPWVRVLDLQGEEIPSQVIYRDGKHWLCFHARVPAFGYTQVRLVAREEEADPDSDPNRARAKRLTAENRFYRIELTSRGRIRQIFDKELKKDLLSGAGNKLHYYKNHPKEWSNWNLDPDYEEHEIFPKGEVSVEVVDPGPVVAALRVTWPAAEGGQSTQEIRIYRDHKRIDFINDIDVCYRESLVKVSFPFKMKAEKVTTEIAYGTYDRPTKATSSFDKAKWEAWTQKWLDLAGDEVGVTMMNKAKYGFDCKGDTLRLTLIKGGIEPDPNTDLYTHRIEYALFSHAGDFRQAHAWQQGHAYNIPIFALLEEEHEGVLPQSKSFASLSADNACWEAFKPTEDGNGFVVRVYETEGRDLEEVILDLPFPVKKAEEIDFLELKVLGDLKVEESRIRFPLSHNEIKAIRFFL